MPVYPKNAPRMTTSRAERTLWAALEEKLPGHWHAWHSLRLRTNEGLMGEGDFVIAAPEYGLLALEVKGGRVVCRDGRWFQNTKPMRPPLAQAHGFVRKLAQRFEDKGREVPGWGVAVAFPETEFDTPPTHDDLDRVVLGERELEWLDQTLEQIMDRAIPRSFRKRYSDAEWEDVVAFVGELWGETWVPSVGLGSRVADQRDDWVSLTPTQLSILDGLMANERLLVTGPAGSGKTLLAVEAARRHAAQGLSTWLIVFTRALGLNLETSLPDVRVTTVSNVALELARKAGAVDEIPGSDPNFWNELSLTAAELAETMADADRPDVVIIDEAQDLDDHHWLFLEYLTEGRRLWAFRDTRQAFWADRKVPDFPSSFQLTSTHRSHPGIQALAHACLGEDHDADALKAATEDGSILLEPVRGDDITGAISESIGMLLSQRLRPEEIFVASLRGKSAEGSMAGRDRIGPHRVVRADATEAGRHIVADTFMRLKGLERAGVVVTDLRLLDEARDDQGLRLYITLTRALAAVRIVAPREALEAHPVLGGLL